MNRTMEHRVPRLAVVSAALVLIAAYLVVSNRNPSADASSHRLTPAVRARGLGFELGIAPGDKAWVLAAIAQARPEARELIGVVDGLVTIRTVNEPNMPYVGLAEQGTDDIRLNIAFLDGEREQDRATTVLHELGHIIDFELIPDDEIVKLAGEVPASGACLTPETGDCTAPKERFADTFAKWALRGAVSSAGAGYGVMSPASLEEWGAPLGLLAAQESLLEKK
jgi:hypothetical protein